MFRKSIKLVLVILGVYAICSSAAVKASSTNDDSLRIEIGRVIDRCEKLINTSMLTSLDSALVLLDSSAVLIRGHFSDEDTLLARTYHIMSSCYLALGDFDRSIAIVNEAIEIWTTAPGQNHIQILKGLDNLITCGLYRHDLIECEQVSERRFGILDGLSEPLSTAEKAQMIATLNDNGRLKVLQSRYDEAIEEFNQALNLITDEMVEGPQDRAGLIGNIGWAYSFQGKYAEAEEYLTKAIELMKVAYHPKHRVIEVGFDFLSNIARQQGDMVRANQFADSSLILAQEVYGTSHPSLSGTYQMKARLLVALDSADAAVEFAKRAVKVNREASDYPTNLFMGSLETLGNIALAASRFELADSNFSEFLAARHSFLKTVFGYASESQKLAYMQQYPPIIFTLLSGAVANPKPGTRRVAMDMVLNGKGLAIDALASEKAAAICSDDPILDSLLIEHKTTCAEIARLALSSRSGDEDVRRKLGDLYSEKNQIEIGLSRLCSNLDLIIDAGSISSSALASALPGRSVLWEFVKYRRIDLDRLYQSNDSLDEFYVALTLTPDDDIAFTDLGVASSIDSLIAEYRLMMSDAMHSQLTSQTATSTNQLKEVSSELYMRLVAPLENTLHGVDEVYVATDGAINLLPFETLTKDGEKYLIEDHRFVYLTSGRDLLKEEVDRAGQDAIVIADPDYMMYPSAFPEFAAEESSQVFAGRGNIDAPECLGSMFSPLPMSRREGSAITRILEQTDINDVSYWESGEAREGSLKQLKQAPRVLHIATHGYFCEQAQNNFMSNPLLRSGLLLAGANRTIGLLDDVRPDSEDGILTALEVSGLNLVGTDLVVLSACQTGLGEVQNGEGVFGLRRAFQHAGAKSIIMSMFDVPDESTSLMMERFYTNWLSGESKSAALRDATLSILREHRDQHGTAHPIFWGGFVLVGDPD